MILEADDFEIGKKITVHTGRTRETKFMSLSEGYVQRFIGGSEDVIH